MINVNTTQDLREAYSGSDRDIRFPDNSNLLLVPERLGSDKVEELQDFGSTFQRSLHLRRN